MLFDIFSSLFLQYLSLKIKEWTHSKKWYFIERMDFSDKKKYNNKD